MPLNFVEKIMATSSKSLDTVTGSPTLQY